MLQMYFRCLLYIFEMNSKEICGLSVNSSQIESSRCVLVASSFYHLTSTQRIILICEMNLVICPCQMTNALMCHGIQTSNGMRQI